MIGDAFFHAFYNFLFFFLVLRQANNFYCFELSFHSNYTDRWKPDEKNIGSIADECLWVLKRIFSWSLTLLLHWEQERFFHCNAEFYNMQLILISCIRWMQNHFSSVWRILHVEMFEDVKGTPWRSICLLCLPFFISSESLTVFLFLKCIFS